ncbi:MAG: Hsp20/alpha crystallin family protein [Polyangiaceae bacterium]
MSANQYETHRAEPTRTNEGRRVTPAVDIYENASGFLIVADVPGVEPSGLNVEFNPPELRVSGRPQSGGVVYERRFELGSGVDPSTTNAELKNGVLRIELKKTEAVKPRRIDVRAS